MIRLILICLFLCGYAQAMEEFTAMTYDSSSKEKLNYRIHLPEIMDAAKQYPLVLFLHGAGERGDDNKSQLRHGAQDILAFSKTLDTPAIIIVPQCPNNQKWVDTPWGSLSHTMPKKPSASMQMVLELLSDSIKKFPVDKNRIYVTGISMGGFGTWDIIQRYPALFAAAIPICGGGDTALAPKLTKLPIWTFHGGADTAVKTVRSQSMIAAIKKAGGNPKYTEYEGVGHNSWTRTYNNKEVLRWLFSQQKTKLNK